MKLHGTTSSLARLLLLAIAVTLAACEYSQRAALTTYMAFNQNLKVSDGSKKYGSDTQDFIAEAVVEGFTFPWDLHFIDAEHILLTEKPGRLWRINVHTREQFPISGVPDSVMYGQGGLLGVVAHPEFASNHYIYLSYSIATEPGAWTTRLARAELRNDQLHDLQVLFTASPATSSGNHFGGAMVFGSDGFLYLSVGDRGNRKLAQQLDSHPGKILRFHPDGRVPVDNPFADQPGAKPEIWTYGNRNPQGLSINPATGVIWEAEHGPQGGDEINRIEKGHNYGWPEITYGEEYGGGKIGSTEQAGMKQPVHYYVPSIGTAGLLYYHGDRFPAWHGNIFVAGLRSTSISRVPIENGNEHGIDKGVVRGEERLFADLSMRMRNIELGPDGLIYVLTENGILFRLRPAEGNCEEDCK